MGLGNIKSLKENDMADLSAFATKDTANDGVVIPVKIDGIKFPMAIKVYGSDSDTVVEYERNKIRKLGLAKKGKKEIDEDLIEEILENQDEGVLIRIGGIWTYDWEEKKVVNTEPLELNGKTLSCDRDSYEYLIEKMPSIKDWVMEKSNDRSYFLSNRKKD